MYKQTTGQTDGQTEANLINLTDVYLLHTLVLFHLP